MNSVLLKVISLTGVSTRTDCFWVSVCLCLWFSTQCSHREEASTLNPSPISVPPWSPRRYLPFWPLMPTRPYSTNSKKKSSGLSPSVHTRPLPETYQNSSFPPVVEKKKTHASGILRRSAQQSQCCSVKLSSVSAHTTWLTFYMVCAIAEEQWEDVVNRATGVQCIGVLVVTHKAVLPTQDQDRTINQL